MADTRVVFPACPCPIRAILRRLAPSYTFTGCLLPQAYGKVDTARDEDEYRIQASPTTPAKLLMLTQGVGMVPRRDGRPRPSSRSEAPLCSFNARTEKTKPCELRSLGRPGAAVPARARQGDTDSLVPDAKASDIPGYVVPNIRRIMLSSDLCDVQHRSADGQRVPTTLNVT